MADAPKSLAGKTVSAAYVLEYGVDKIEMHIDAVKAGQKVVLIDDLVATGGTAAAGTCCRCLLTTVPISRELLF